MKVIKNLELEDLISVMDTIKNSLAVKNNEDYNI